MASTDVIELGSSDDEAEPAPKRRKPPPNAMVHIPNRLPSGVTVTPSKNKSRINPSNILKGALSQSLTVKKIPKKNMNPYANVKINGNPIKSPVIIKQASDIKPNVAGHIHKDNNLPLKRKSTQNSSKMMTPFGLALHRCINSKKPPNPTGVSQTDIYCSNMTKILQSSVGRKSESKSHLTNTSLPPGITIKRTTPKPKNINPISKKLKSVSTPFSLVRISNIGSVTQTTTSGGVLTETMQTAEVPTVNLDDDEPPTSSSCGPQWYLRPEELNKKVETKGSQEPLIKDSSMQHTNKGATKADSVKRSDKTSPEKIPKTAETSLEKQNNEEPDKTTYIEITIEDSPIKPQKVKKGFKVGSELAITIDDSPIKNVNEKASHCNSEDEEDQPKTRSSKKKLQYSKTVQAVEEIEIEFEPCVEIESNGENNASSSKEEESCKKSMTPTKEKETAFTEKSLDSSNIPNAETKTEKPKRVVECIEIVEIEESPVKPVEEKKTTTPEKNKPTKPVIKMTEMETIDLEDKEKDEFTSIYQSFIKLCFQLENSEDMKKIVEKKIKGYYRQVPKDYTESETFTDLVSSKIVAMKASPEKMYLYIKDVVDELNLQRKLAKAQPAIEKEEQQKFLYGEESEFDAKRQRQIRKLEKTLKKLHRAIQKLEEQEVDFDDEEDSVYLLTESEDDTSTKDDRPLSKEVLLQRYKERSVRVHAKLCQLTNTKMPSEARVQIDPRPNQPKGPSKRLEKWINRKVPIGTPLPFPDFHDVLRCVREANQEDKLGWNEADVMEEARDLFVRCGKKLQRRRQENEWRLAASRVPADMADPAENSTDLKKKLEENRRLAAKKETEVFNKFADRQKQLQLEAVEIGDKEAEESPVESDDEEHAEVSDSLTDKEKRKERLKRLLHEKSKVSDVKENQEEKILSDDKSSQDDSTKDSNKAEIGTKDSEDRKDSRQNLSDEEPSNIELTKDNKDNNLSDSNSKIDGSKVDSDVDELHLLEKLYSDNEYNNAGSSDTASPIAISDTSSMNDKTSSDERRTKKSLSDVISIENSSYSESEENNADSVKDTDTEKNIEKTVVPMELDFSVDTKEKISDETKNGNRNVINSPSTSSKEDILLASSDEGNDTEPPKDNRVGQTCINLKDDNISIGETLIIENRDLDGDSEASKADNSEKNTITDSSSVEGMEIGPTELNSKDQNLTNDIVETVSVESLIEENASTLSSTKSPENNEDRSPEITNISSVETISDDHANIENVEETIKTNLSNAINKVIESTTDVVQRIDEEKVDNETCSKPNKTSSETIQNLEESNTNQSSQNQRHETESNLKQTESNDLRANSECSTDDVIMRSKDDVSVQQKNTHHKLKVPKTSDDIHQDVKDIMCEPMEVDSVD